MDPHVRTNARLAGVRHRFEREAVGNGGVGATGAVGPPGPSAFAVAVQNGFVGSEADWLASLIGPAGAGSDPTFETVNRNLDADGASSAVDGNGVVQSVSYTSGVIKTFSYDGDGRVIEVALSGNTPAGIDLVKTFTYDADGSFSTSYS